ncbi:TrmH family RNA methyltransferase [Bifidobacterium phasiani]|uniref:RNA methyltransferase n=1 Tax=Bifidobacterium phasiani TaxID=2834431 RepID=A0ABS6W9B7_9BIFI|nr:RNA methyltransferase [Bifidobacterium phasiani]MBW3082927.1 RNA methyltransferase [Bifidobacterium phasiani]
MPMNSSFLDNPRSERVRRVAELSNRKARERAGRFAIEGPQSVREAVRYAPGVIRDLYVACDADRFAGRRSADDAPVPATFAPIVAQALERGIYVHLCDRLVLDRMSRDAQGILAVGDVAAMRRDFGALSDDGTAGGDAADGNATGGAAPDLVAAFWQVRDPGNAGTVIRAADAAGCRAVVFVDECVDMLNPKVIRSTAGSLFHLPVLTMGTDGFLAWCAGRGLRIVAADVYGTPGRRPESLPALLAGEAGPGAGGEARAVLFGNEARGLPADILARVDRIVSIPIYGRAESLNLGTSAAVMLMSLAMSSR